MLWKSNREQAAGRESSYRAAEQASSVAAQRGDPSPGRRGAGAGAKRISALSLRSSRLQPALPGGGGGASSSGGSGARSARTCDHSSQTP